MQVWPYALSWHFWLRIKVGYLNCTDKYILIELSELVVFEYGLSETQEDISCLSNWI